MLITTTDGKSGGRFSGCWFVYVKGERAETSQTSTLFALVANLKKMCIGQDGGHNCSPQCARVHVCMCARVCVLPGVPFVHAKLPRASTHIILAKGCFNVMREGGIRFPPALSLLTRVWVGVTEVPRGR